MAAVLFENGIVYSSVVYVSESCLERGGKEERDEGGGGCRCLQMKRRRIEDEEVFTESLLTTVV